MIREVSRHTPSRGGLRSRKIEQYDGLGSAELARRIAAWCDKGVATSDPEFRAVCGRMANRYARQLEALQMGGLT